MNPPNDNEKDANQHSQSSGLSPNLPPDLPPLPSTNPTTGTEGDDETVIDKWRAPAPDINAPPPVQESDRMSNPVNNPNNDPTNDTSNDATDNMTGNTMPPITQQYGSSNPAVTAGKALADELRAEIRKALIGQGEVVDQVLIALFAGGHVLLEGVPGLGKTLLVRALSQCMGGSFSRVQFTPDLMPSDVTGHAMYDMKTEQFNIRRGPVFCNFLLADEINRAPAKTQAALLEVMQERQVTIEGESQLLPPPFMVMATQNPVEQEGTYPLPEAQLDRFLLKVLIDYPNADDEVALVDLVSGSGVGQTLDVDSLKTLATLERIVELQQVVQQIQVDQRITQYAVEIVRSTREWSGIAVGAGPRGSIALILAARAAAMLAGRDFVIPDDVKSIAVAALGHRILLAPELEMEGRQADEVITELVNSITAPRM